MLPGPIIDPGLETDMALAPVGESPLVTATAPKMMPNGIAPTTSGMVARTPAHLWSIASVEEELGMIYLPLGNQTPDQWAADRTPGAEKYSAGEIRTIKARVRRAARARRVQLPDPEEFVELMARVRKKRR